MSSVGPNRIVAPPLPPTSLTPSLLSATLAAVYPTSSPGTVARNGSGLPPRIAIPVVLGTGLIIIAFIAFLIHGIYSRRRRQKKQTHVLDKSWNQSDMTLTGPDVDDSSLSKNEKILLSPSLAEKLEYRSFRYASSKGYKGFNASAGLDVLDRKQIHHVIAGQRRPKPPPIVPSMPPSSKVGPTYPSSTHNSPNLKTLHVVRSVEILTPKIEETIQASISSNDMEDISLSSPLKAHVSSARSRRHVDSRHIYASYSFLKTPSEATSTPARSQAISTLYHGNSPCNISGLTGFDDLVSAPQSIITRSIDAGTTLTPFGNFNTPQRAALIQDQRALRLEAVARSTPVDVRNECVPSLAPILPTEYASSYDAMSIVHASVLSSVDVLSTSCGHMQDPYERTPSWIPQESWMNGGNLSFQ